MQRHGQRKYQLVTGEHTRDTRFRDELTSAVAYGLEKFETRDTVPIAHQSYSALVTR